MCARVRMIQQRWWVGHSHSSGAISAEPNTQTADFYSRRDLQRIVVKRQKKARGWWRRLCVRLRGPDVFSVVFGIARWRSARCSASQAGRKEAAARVSRRGQSIQPSFSRLLLLFFWRNLCRLPAPLLVGFVVSSTHLLTDVQLLISQPSLPTYRRHFRLSSCLMLRPPGR